MLPDRWGSDYDYAEAMGTHTREGRRVSTPAPVPAPDHEMTADEIRAAFDALFASLDQVSAGRRRQDDEDMGAALAARSEVTR